MNTGKGILARSALVGFMFVLCLVGSAQSQTVKPDEKQTVQELLAEVRLLRRTLERTNFMSSRAQIVLELMRRHNERVQSLTRELEGCRDQVERTESTIPKMIDQAKVLESLVERESDATQRMKLEYEVKQTRRSVEEYKQILERQREREIQIAAQLRAEQQKLSELDGRLEMLDREIQNEVERQRSEDAREGKK